MPVKKPMVMEDRRLPYACAGGGFCRVQPAGRVELLHLRLGPVPIQRGGLASMAISRSRVGGCVILDGTRWAASVPGGNPAKIGEIVTDSGGDLSLNPPESSRLGTRAVVAQEVEEWN